MEEKIKTPGSPYLRIFFSGFVIFRAFENSFLHSFLNKSWVHYQTLISSKIVITNFREKLRLLLLMFFNKI